MYIVHVISSTHIFREIMLIVTLIGSMPSHLSMSFQDLSFLVSIWSLMSSLASCPADSKRMAPGDSSRLCQCLEVHLHFHQGEWSQPSTVLHTWWVFNKCLSNGSMGRCLSYAKSSSLENCSKLNRDLVHPNPPTSEVMVLLEPHPCKVICGCCIVILSPRPPLCL